MDAYKRAEKFLHPLLYEAVGMKCEGFFSPMDAYEKILEKLEGHTIPDEARELFEMQLRQIFDL